MGISIIIIFIVTLLVAIAWTRGIDKMKDEHPDYKGEDLFGTFDNINKQKKKKEDE